MERKYKKKFPKVTLYKYEYSQYYSSKGVIVTPIETDLTCKGFTIRGKEPYLDKSIKNEYIDHLFRYGEIGHYEYTMYSLLNNKETLLGFLERIQVLADKELQKVDTIRNKKYQIYRSITNYINELTAEDELPFIKEEEK